MVLKPAKTTFSSESFVLPLYTKIRFQTSGYVGTQEPETSNSNYEEAVEALKVPAKSKSPS